MENKKSVGRYNLIFEPSYVSYQYALTFNGDTIDINKVNKYKDIICGSKSKVKKNSLSEIDRITASMPDLSSFFKKYVPNDIFSYYQSNLHKIFIGYMYNDYMYSFKPVFNNPKLLSKLDLVSGSTIRDHDGITKMITLVLESDDNGFLRFISSAKANKETNLSKETLFLAERLRNAELNFESSADRYELRKDLESKLSSYKEYREMFLLRYAYLDKLEEDKKRLENKKQELLETQKQPKPFIEQPVESIQLTLFDDEPKYKVLKREGH